MPENEIVEEISTEVIETDSVDNNESSDVDIEPDILDDVPGSEEDTTEVSETVEETEVSGEDIPDSTENIPDEETTQDSVSENDIEKLPEDMTEELTEELSEEMTEESTEYILYMTESETEIPFLQKSFNEYSVSEGLLLLIFIILLLLFVKNILFD